MGKHYRKAMKELQIELIRLQHGLHSSGKRLLVIFEGRDTAGKGGAVDAIRRHLNPRQCRVVALPKPDEREKTEWYFQRYAAQLPAAGEIVLFDRSWYNRAGVEKVMDFATDAQVEAFLQQAPQFEQQLVDDGILLFKYWLCCDQAQQEKRFAERLDNPLKGWKLSPIDLSARTLTRISPWPPEWSMALRIRLTSTRSKAGASPSMNTASASVEKDS